LFTFCSTILATVGNCRFLARAQNKKSKKILLQKTMLSGGTNWPHKRHPAAASGRIRPLAQYCPLLFAICFICLYFSPAYFFWGLGACSSGQNLLSATKEQL
jgi:hypothetical protein